MANSQNRIMRFWQELKRRKVIKVIVMYAGSAFVLFDLANNVVEPMNLPAWLPRVIIWIALGGFPIVVVLSWIFDITPEGIDKTKSIEDIPDPEDEQATGRRRLKASDVIIMALFVLVGILAYPRIFRERNLNAMTIPITVVNEFGERETRRVFKEDYLTRLALFPFSNESMDSLLNWMQWGIMDAVIEDQQQFSNMLIEYDDAAVLSEQIAFAREVTYPFFLTGTLSVDGNLYEITTRLYQTSNGTVRNEHVFRGADFFGLIDSICMHVRSDLGISEVILNATADLPVKDLLTDNLEAYGNYIQGRYFWHFDYRNVMLYLYKAIQLDSTFAKACYRFAALCYYRQLSDESAVRAINQAIRHRQRLSEFSDVATRILYYQIIRDTIKVIDLSELQYELRPRDLSLLTKMYYTYLQMNEIDRAEEVAFMRNELVPNHPPYQIELAFCYLLSGKPDKSVEILNQVLKGNPENVGALLQIGQAYLHVKDLDAAEEAFKRAIILMPEQENHWSKLLDIISFERNNAINEKFLKPYEGIHRQEEGGMTTEIRIIQDQLCFKSKNQGFQFLYPISDTVFVSAWKYGDVFDFIQVKWIFSSSGKAIRGIGEQWDGPDYYYMPTWIEDKLIIHAKDLMASNRFKEALAAFREVYDQNPQHYYLANFIQFLEFILSSDYTSSMNIFNSYIGYYNGRSFHKEDGKLFYIDQQGLIFELLPISEARFMVPSIYMMEVQIVKDQDVVSGLKLLYRDGREEYFQRTTTKVQAQMIE